MSEQTSVVKSEAASQDQNVAHTEKDDSRLYADNGWRAWSTVIGSWLILCCAVGVISSFGVFQEYYTTTWLPESSAAAISWIGSIQIFLEYFMAPLGGELMDRGHFRTAVILGCGIFVFSLFMLSLTGHAFYQILLSQGIGMGMGVGLLFLPASVVAIKHFRQGHAFVIGLVDSSISLGGLLFTVSLNYLVHGRVGFAWGVRIVAFVVLGCFSLGVSMMSMPKGGFDGPKIHVQARTTWKQGFIMSLGTFIPPFYIQLFSELHGIKKETSFYALAVMNVTGMLGRIIPNYLADRLGVLNVYIPCLATTGVLCFAMLGADTVNGLFPFAVFYGFFFGATNGMYFALITSLSTDKPEYLWKRCGLSLLPPAVAALVGPPIAGSILGKHYVWWRAITFASLTMITASILVILARRFERRKE